MTRLHSTRLKRSHWLVRIASEIRTRSSSRQARQARHIPLRNLTAVSSSSVPEGCGNSSAPDTNRRKRFEFALFVDAGKISPMNSSSPNSANPWIAKVHQLFSRDLALENDYLRQENKILRSKLGARVPLSESDRRILVKYGLR